MCVRSGSLRVHYRCWSYLGSSGGRQTLSLQSPECVSSGVVSHQLMHVLGFVHEQSRPDRDKYVTIMWSKIWKGKQTPTHTEIQC